MMGVVGGEIAEKSSNIGAEVLDTSIPSHRTTDRRGESFAAGRRESE
jgi:hypothetical protein